MKQFFTATILVFSLSGCNFNSVSEISRVSDSIDSDFQHKIECSKYLADAEAKVQKFAKQICGEDAMCWPNMEKVFYSPKANSCLFSWSNNMVQYQKDFKYQRGDRGLNDALTGEELIREIYIEGDPVLGRGTELESDQRFFDKVHVYE